MPYSSVKDLPANIQKLPAKKARQWMHVWNSSFDACMKRDEGGTSACETEAFRKANGVVKGVEMPDGSTSPSKAFYDNLIRLEKTATVANYRANGSEGWQCGDCRFFDEPYRQCSLVEGTIEATYVCDLYTDRLPSQPEYPSGMYTEQTVQIFVEASKAFNGKLGKSSWIPFLPTPGVFKHPSYGEIEITKEGNQAFVQSVKDGVYQEHIPLDAEHETKLSGAVGWITDMRMNDDSGADALIEWTDRGRTLVEAGQFKYVSPEWFDQWTDPATEVVHKNVIAGGAITTRPFFKDKVLRALVASETGHQVIGQEEHTVPDPKDPKDAKKTYAEGTPEYDALVAQIKADATKGLLAPESDEFKEAVRVAAEAAKADPKADPKDPKSATEPTKEFIELQTRVTAAETQASELKTANETLAKSLTAITNADRHRRFSALVSGIGGENDGGPWVGDKDKHVTFLEKLADKVGETDEMFTDYITQQNAAAAQAQTAGLFSQSGSSASGGTVGADRLEQLARARMNADPAKPIGYAEAYDAVLATPEGAKIYGEQEQRRMRSLPSVDA